MQNFDKTSRQNSDQNLSNDSGKILAKFWQEPWVEFRPEFYSYRLGKQNIMKKLCLNSSHNSSENLEQNFNRIATIIW